MVTKPSQTTDITQIKFHWEEAILVLSPTVEEWRDFPAILECAQHHKAHLVGAFKAVVSASLQQGSSRMEAGRGQRACQTYKVTRVEGPAGFYQIHQPQSIIPLDLSPPPINATMTTEEALSHMEGIMDQEDLEGVQYISDIPLTTREDREAAGLPAASLIWPLQGNQLARREKNLVPGIHLPLGYQSGNQFGALFCFHVEDGNLHSLSHLHQGRKIWIIIPPEGLEALETQLVNLTLRKTCTQFVRHENVFFLPSCLEEWGVPHHVLDQQSQEIVVTFPGTYHGGFSIGQGNAEATNYGGSSWTLAGYLDCQTETCKGPLVTSEDLVDDLPIPPRKLRGKVCPHPACHLSAHICAQRDLPPLLPPCPGWDLPKKAPGNVPIQQPRTHSGTPGPDSSSWTCPSSTWNLGSLASRR